jgi:hypothetical protein
VRVFGGRSLSIATFALALGACGELDIVDHDPLLLEPEGNFPADAQDRCGPLPPDVVPIAGLQSAWAMTEMPVEGDTSFRAATKSVVLRLSDDGVPCGVALEPELIGCPSAWAVDVTLRNTDLGPGTFALESYGQGWDLATAQRVDRSCVRDQEQGGFAGGTVEIFTVTEDCVVGRLVGTTDELPAAGSPVEGGFVALRCEPDEE